MPGSGSARRATAVEFAIGLVAARSWPEKKLREKIAARYAPDETDAALARLRELGMVDDEAWAERFARDRFERGGKGRHRIRGELLQKGIDAATADQALARLADSDLEREKATRVLETLRRRLSRGSAVDAVEAGGEPRPSRAAASRANPSGMHSGRAPDAEETLKNRLFRRMLARGYPASLVRDLLDVS